MTSEFGIAVHALIFLNHKDRILSSEELSKNICTNPARVRKVLAKLKKAGLVATKEGAEGGYLFIRDINTVSLADIGKAVDACFVSAAWRSGDMDMNCLVSSGMAGIMDRIYEDLNKLCYERLQNIQLKDINNVIFNESGCKPKD